MVGSRLYNFLIAVVRAVNKAKADPSICKWEGKSQGITVTLELKE